MLSISNHQGDANQNHKETTPHTCQNSYHQKKKKPTNDKGWQECKEKEASIQFFCPFKIRLLLFDVELYELFICWLWM